MFFFFFSSRRRHTRCGRDWSSDVCSSDLQAGIVSFGNRLCVDEALQAKVEGWLEQIVGYLVDQYRGELADLVAGTVRSWDTEQTSRKIELQVGRDLQWIRVNGTVVGGLASLVIYTLA